MSAVGAASSRTRTCSAPGRLMGRCCSSPIPGSAAQQDLLVGRAHLWADLPRDGAIGDRDHGRGHASGCYVFFLMVRAFGLLQAIIFLLCGVAFLAHGLLDVSAMRSSTFSAATRP